MNIVKKTWQTVIFCLFLLQVLQAAVAVEDSLALVALYNSTNGANWSHHENWLAGEVSTWYGIDVLDGHVHRIYLQTNNLNGILPPDIGNLSRITQINITNNEKLTGSIPAEIGNLTNLKTLELFSNAINGSIPVTIRHLVNLERLFLSGNDISGEIPPEIGQLQNLAELDLGHNELTGVIPSEIGNLSKLERLNLDINQLDGTIPAEIGNLLKLTSLSLAANRLTDSIPAEIGNLTHLTNLRLYQNNLTGAIPREIGQLTNLTQLWLHSNRFEQNLPDEITHLTNLEYLYLFRNQLTGAVPARITNLTKLKVFKIDHNTLDDFPNVTSISTLNELYLQNNKLTFEDIVPNMSIANFLYAPQDSVGEKRAYKIDPGANFTLSVSVGGENNDYQWLKNGQNIPGATNDSYTITSAGENDAGRYNCQVTNPEAPALILCSRSMEVAIRGFGIDQDSLALVELYYSTNGSQWFNAENWLTTEPLSHWHGITVGHGRVVAIQLQNNNLEGPLPADIGAITNLERIDLSGNLLSDTIPHAIGNLVNLTCLDFYRNNLSGFIPAEIGNLRKLEELYLSNNQLSEFIPPEIYHLINLKYLYLDTNQLTGTISVEITNLDSLKVLNYSYNQLAGTIPDEIGSLSNLTSIYLGYNQLGGIIPSSIGNLTELTTLELPENQFTGSIPLEICNLTKLQHLALQRNQLEGSIPQRIGNLAELTSFYCYENQLSGAVPTSITSLLELKYFYTNGNQLVDLPDMSSMPDLNRVKVQNNRLTFEDLESNMSIANFIYAPQDSFGIKEYFSVELGTSLILNVLIGGTQNQYQWSKDDYDIPQATNSSYVIDSITPHDDGMYVCRTTNSIVPNLTIYSRPKHVSILGYGIEQDSLALVALYDSTNGANWTNKENWLSQNPLSMWYGVVVKKDRMTELNLDNNNLVGSIPPALGNALKLEKLILNNNQLNDSIPSSIAQLATLTVLSLASNQLTGQLFPEIGQLTKLTSLDLSWNELTGSIPPEIGNLRQLTYLNLGGNHFADIPSTLYELSNLSHVYLNSNELDGPLPSQFVQLSNLRTLFLHDNRFTGEIPHEFFTLSNLHWLNLSNNHLDGSIPSDINKLSTLGYLYLDGNQFTGGIPAEIGDLTGLVRLYLQNNQLIGTIPPEIGNLSELKYLYLNRNQLIGHLPVELTRLVHLTRLSVHGNQLAGAVPDELFNMTDLERVYIHNNRFVDFPDVSSLANLKILHIYNNRLTFEDIEPNVGIEDYNYSPQDSVGSAKDTTVAAGTVFRLAVSVGGTANDYQWQLNGADIAGATSNTLTINNIQDSDSGTYTCVITNRIATALTLYNRPIHVSVSGDVGIDTAQLDIPKEFGLLQNYPNPFNPQTTIQYNVPKTAFVTLVIYNVLGHKVCTLIEKEQPPGYYAVVWDGKDMHGHAVGSGTYFYRLTSAEFNQTRRLLFIR
ncbi:T9SS C-terminal target domain-containing protein [candidate division KSB1 bacterium]|nr:leucine-rich repeat domain-containing protein [candidate division KSB1 bacterium]RQW06873.1 MAG: T9SS C-terminal target domain-containing protein [candidate division KSB1 bacterium]